MYIEKHKTIITNGIYYNDYGYLKKSVKFYYREIENIYNAWIIIEVIEKKL